MNFLSLFVLIPLLMLLSLWLVKGAKGVRAVMVVGSSALLALAIGLTIKFLLDRAGGNTAEMLYTASFTWFAPLHISYSVGVDGISVAMLLLSGVSFMSWYYIFRKWFTIRKARTQTEQFERDFWSGGDLNNLYQSAVNNRHGTGSMERVFE